MTMTSKNNKKDPERSAWLGREFNSDIPWCTDREGPDLTSIEDDLYITGEKMKKEGNKDATRQSCKMQLLAPSTHRMGRCRELVDEGDAQPSVGRKSTTELAYTDEEQGGNGVPSHQELAATDTAGVSPITNNSIPRGHLEGGENVVRPGARPGAVHVQGPAGLRHHDEESLFQGSEADAFRPDTESTTTAPPVIEAQLVENDDRTQLYNENRLLREFVGNVAQAQIMSSRDVGARRNKCLPNTTRNQRLGLALLLLSIAIVAVVLGVVFGKNTPSPAPGEDPTAMPSTAPPTNNSVNDFTNTVSLKTIIPSGGVCDYQYNFLTGNNFVCTPQEPGGGEYMIQFDGPPLTWNGLPDSVTMIYRASGNLLIDANGTFLTDVAIVTVDYESNITSGGIGDSVSSFCSITIDEDNVGADCGSVGIQTFTNVEGAHLCRLNYFASTVAPPTGPFKQLELTFEIPSTIQAEWDNVCGSGTKEYIWFERYYFSGFRTYNHWGTVLSVF